MFILRKIGVIERPTTPPRNFILGKSYTYYHSEETAKEFEEFLEKVDDEIADSDKIYAFVFDENGTYYPLSVNERNFIMTDSGKTFENLSPRK